MTAVMETAPDFAREHAIPDSALKPDHSLNVRADNEAGCLEPGIVLTSDDGLGRLTRFLAGEVVGPIDYRSCAVGNSLAVFPTSACSAEAFSRFLEMYAGSGLIDSIFNSVGEQ